MISGAPGTPYAIDPRIARGKVTRINDTPCRLHSIIPRSLFAAERGDSASIALYLAEYRRTNYFSRERHLNPGIQIARKESISRIEGHRRLEIGNGLFPVRRSVDYVCLAVYYEA